MRGVWLVLASAACAFLAAADWSAARAQARAERGFTISLSERAVQAYTRQFGPAARGRLEAWKRYAAERKAAPLAEAELLRDVNRTLNRIRFVDDATHW